jgi:hypothetical protein
MREAHIVTIEGGANTQKHASALSADIYMNQCSWS